MKQTGHEVEGSQKKKNTQQRKFSIDEIKEQIGGEKLTQDQAKKILDTMREKMGQDETCELLVTIWEKTEQQVKAENTSIDDWDQLDRILWSVKEAYCYGFLDGSETAFKATAIGIRNLGR